MRRWATVVGVALPGVALAAFGLAHPSTLTATTAHTWWTLHVYLVPVFPLVGAAVWVLLRGERGPVAQVARLAAYGFAAFYTALDVLAGIGAGLVVEASPDDPVVYRLFTIGDRLGHAGIISLLVAILLLGAVSARRSGPRVLPGVVLAALGCWPFYTHHIFHPWGAAGVLAIGVGLGLVAWARPQHHV